MHVQLPRATIAISCACALAAPARAATIAVPADQPTIQAALDAATNGDEIVVAAGSYVETISLLGKAITLRSAAGSAVTTIDGTGAGVPVVSCTAGEGPGTVIEGFTITGGDPDPGAGPGGGGLLAIGSAPTIRSCVFIGNTARAGGGLYCDGGAPRLEACRFESNVGGRGGAASLVGGAAPVFDACELTENRTLGPGDCGRPNGSPGCSNPLCADAVCDRDPFCCLSAWDEVCVEQATFLCDNSAIDAHGAGIHSDGCTPRLIDCLIVGNDVLQSNAGVGDGGGEGGGVYGRGGTVTLLRCRLDDNMARQGGGVYGDAAVIRAVSCEIVSNRGLAEGGVGSRNATIEILNSLVADNAAVFGPTGGVGLSGGSCRIVNTTITTNSSADSGTGVGVYNRGVLEIDNSIVHGNFGYGGAEQIFTDFQSPPAVVRFTCVEGGFPGLGNIGVDPLFVDAPAGDFRLVTGSPCADAGHNHAVPPDDLDLDADGNVAERLPHDLDGTPRFVADDLDFDPGCGLGGIVDMGAYETPGTPLGDLAVGDVNADGRVDVDDLVLVVLEFGPCHVACCVGDVDFDGVIDIDDIVLVILNWG